MEFRDLKQQYQVLKQDIDRAVTTVFANANFISGKEVGELEERLAAFTGRKHCIAVANGTEALSLPLMAWGIGKNDAVFVPDFTFFASGEVVAEVGATPVFVDVEKETFNLSPKALEEAILQVQQQGKLTPRAVIPVDLFGLPANFPEIEKIAKKYNLLILEDGAQGFGGAVHGKRACSFGDCSTTSFFPAKPLGCYGDGGAIFTDDDNLDALLRSLRVHGKGDDKYDNVRLGRNSRLDTVQAAVLGVKLTAFEEYELAKVNEAYEMYNKALEGISATLPVIPDGFYSSFAQYTLILKDRATRDGLQKFLKDKGIPSMVYYPKPMHRQKAFEGKALAMPCPNTEFLCDTVLSLPMHPYLTQEIVDTVAAAVKEYLK